MKQCCLKEAKLHLNRHRDVATCDECGALLLAYGNDRDFHSTVAELEDRGLDYETEKVGKLFIVAKPS